MRYIIKKLKYFMFDYHTSLKSFKSTIMSSPQKIQGGYSTELFVVSNKNELDNYICFICMDVARDASVLECGHIYCNECISHAVRTGPKQCSACRKPFQQILSSPWHLIKIQGFPVKCKNYELGCQFTNALSRISEHELSQCDYRFGDCDYCGRSDIFVKDLSTHRHLECEFRPQPCSMNCGIMITPNSKEYHLREVCSNVIVECINGCKHPVQEDVGAAVGAAVVAKYEELLPLTMTRHNMQNHLDQCPLQKLPCQYKIHGCKELVCRKDMVAHQADVSLHFQIVCAYQTKREEEFTSRLSRLESILLAQSLPTQATTIPLVATLPEGRVSTHCHHHQMEACEDLRNHNCDVCKQRLVPDSASRFLGFRCVSGCDFDICVDCFSKNRVIKTKAQLRMGAAISGVPPIYRAHAGPLPPVLPDHHPEYLDFPAGPLVAR